MHYTILPPLLLQVAEFVKGRSHGAIEQPLVKLKVVAKNEFPYE